MAAILLAACDPAANIVAPTQGYAGLEIAFNSELLPQYTPNSLPNAQYDWDFGDGSKASGPQASHTYDQPGEYRVVLRIADDATRQWGQAYETVTTVTIHPNATSSALDANTGGDIALPSGANIEIPADALSGDATVSVQAEPAANYTLPEGFTPLSNAITINTGGVSLTKPINVSLPAVDDLPPGQVLAVFMALPPATPIIPANSGLRVAAMSLGGSLLGIPTEALKGGTVNLSVTNPRGLILGAVYEAGLGGLYAAASNNPKWDQLPGTTETACSKDSDYRPLDPSESPSELTQLHSRHVACSQFEALEQSTVVLDKNRLPRTGYFDLKAKWSIHGPSNKLGKRMKLMLSYDYLKPLSPPATEVPVPAMKVRAVLSCKRTTNQANPLAVNCNTTQEFTLSDGTKDMVKEFAIPISWSGGAKIAEMQFDLKLYYSADGTPPTDEGRVLTNNLELVTLRCDMGQVWGQESGCVFPQASAVLVLNNPQSLAHIREAIAANPAMPGQYTGLRAGSRAVALRSFEPSTGLQRLRVTSLIKANRAKSQKLCAALPDRPTQPTACPDFTDPDTTEALTPCDCDEYPFASTRQGAALPRNYGEASVRYISSSDNRSAGAKLGALLRKERMIDPFDHTRLKPRTMALKFPYDPKDAFTVDPVTLDLSFAQNISAYDADFVDQYWISY